MDLSLKFNNKIKLAIIGGSYDSTIAKTHLKSILATNNYNIVCGCFSKNKKKNIKNSKFYSLPINKIYNDYRKLIFQEHKNIEVALVLTPPNERLDIYLKLIKKKIGIISEKPFEGSLNNARKIFNTLENKNFFYVSTYNYLGYPAIMEIKPIIKKIGAVNNIILKMPQQASTLKYNKMKIWRKKDKFIPNLHLDLASHLISIVIYLFDDLPKEVKSIETLDNKNKYINNAFTLLKFKKFPGLLWFSKNATGNRNELAIEIFGSKGGIKWSHNHPELIKFYDNKGNISIINRLSKNTRYLKNSELFTYSPGHPSGFLDAFINIYNQIFYLFRYKKKSPIILNLKNNLSIIEVIHKIHQSHIKKKWQKINI